MDVGKAFTYVFDDEDWLRKVLIGGVLSIIPIANFIASGYTVQAFRNMARGLERPLPEWSNLGEKFGQGLVVFIIGFIYNLPVFLLTACLSATAAVIGSRGNGEQLRDVLSLFQWCLATPYGLLMGILWPAIFSRYAMTGDFAGAFNFREIFAFIQKDLSDYAVVVILALALSIIAGSGLILCCVGVLFTGFWTSLVKTHLFAQLYVTTEAVEAERGESD